MDNIDNADNVYELTESQSIYRAKEISSPTILGAATPTNHTINYGGVMHMPGELDPLKQCTSCHGYNLKGDRARSCYDCHDAKDHQKEKDHRSGSVFTCVTCHGPNNSGGLGQACSDCHGRIDIDD